MFTTTRILALCGFALATSAHAGDGILILTADQCGWSVFVDGKKKAITPNEVGQSFKIQLPEGEHKLEALYDKKTWNGYWEVQSIFVGADVIQPLYLRLSDVDERPKPSTIEHNRQQMAEQGWIDNGDGTVTNTKTKLTWKRCLEGQIWTGSTCQGAYKKYTWDEASKLKIDFAGKTDWRLPSIDELNTIVYCTDGRRPIKRDEQGRWLTVNGEWQNGGCLFGGFHQTPTLNLAAFPTTDVHWAWAGSPVANNTSEAWEISFYDGYVVWGRKDHTLSVRLVRGQ